MELSRRDFLRGSAALALGSVVLEDKVSEAFCNVPTNLRPLPEVFKATVRLSNKTYFNGVLVSDERSGTGLIYKSQNGYYYVATNHHVAVNEEMERDMPLEHRTTIARYGTPIPLELVAADYKRDVAVLRASYDLSDIAFKNYGSIIGKLEDCRQGDEVCFAGYAVKDFEFSKGRLYETNFHHTGNGLDHKDSTFVSPISPGMSGSPLFRTINGDVQWIGMVHNANRDMPWDEMGLSPGNFEVYSKVRQECPSGRIFPGFAVNISDFEDILRSA